MPMNVIKTCQPVYKPVGSTCYLVEPVQIKHVSSVAYNIWYLVVHLHFCFSTLKSWWLMASAIFSLHNLNECIVWLKFSFYIGVYWILTSYHSSCSLFDSIIVFLQRTLGLRFLYPVYCIPEVEITPNKYTSSESIEKGKVYSGCCHKTLWVQVIWASLKR